MELYQFTSTLVWSFINHPFGILVNTLSIIGVDYDVGVTHIVTCMFVSVNMHLFHNTA